MIDLSDLAGTIADFGEPIVRLRAAPGTFAAGVRTAGAATETAATASVQPSKGSEIQRLPEGSRSRDTVTVYWPIDLRSADDRTGAVADLIRCADGSIYEVAAVEGWTIAGFFKAICLRAEGV